MLAAELKRAKSGSKRRRIPGMLVLPGPAARLERDLRAAPGSFRRPASGAVRWCLLLIGLVAGVAAYAATASEKAFDLKIVRGSLPAAERLLRVSKGDALRLRISSDTAGEVHLHGYRLQASLAAGEPSELAFTAYATGRYRLEWHPAGQAQSGSHHGPPLATLEVRPQ